MDRVHAIEVVLVTFIQVDEGVREAHDECHREERALVGGLPSRKWFTSSVCWLALSVALLARPAWSQGGAHIHSVPPASATALQAAPDGFRSPLLAAVGAARQAHPEGSGVHLLTDGPAALAARLRLADASQHQLDLQYGRWNPDASGLQLMHAVLAAANRGVKVRLLLDDEHTANMDGLMAALDEHPRIEVRLFNAYPRSHPRWWSRWTNAKALARRMHNKSFTADQAVSIVGGRQVGDEFFASRRTSTFVDMDAITIGPVVMEVTERFEAYWVSPSSKPWAQVALAAPASGGSFQLSSLVVGGSAVSVEIQQLLNQSLPWTWGTAQVVADDPIGTSNSHEGLPLLTQQLVLAMGTPERSLTLVSPCFAPSEAGQAWLADMLKRGSSARVITLGRTAQGAWRQQARYEQGRQPLLAAGVSLFELRHDLEGAGVLPIAPCANTTHANTFVVDQTRVFIGSFNIDSHQAAQDTDLGLVFDSPPLGASVAQAIDSTLGQLAYQVALDQEQMVWLAQPEGKLTSEPGTTAWQSFIVGALGTWPLSWLFAS